ncbi:UNVERIFIED_CONTAM: hypothetical protein HDU68_002693 [Siphonaria sp. JEL0065]|nr:hypothetical protein HDU68_002693 [Siphonaria sp. JEL0065]
MPLPAPVSTAVFPANSDGLKVARVSILNCSTVNALTGSEKSTLLAPLLAHGWTIQEKDIKEEDFSEAFDFMTHYPEWFVYNRVQVLLTTHDAGNSVSKRDVHLAMQKEDFAKK